MAKTSKIDMMRYFEALYVMAISFLILFNLPFGCAGNAPGTKIRAFEDPVLRIPLSADLYNSPCAFAGGNTKGRKDALSLQTVDHGLSLLFACSF